MWHYTSLDDARFFKNRILTSLEVTDLYTSFLTYTASLPAPAALFARSTSRT